MHAAYFPREFQQLTMSSTPRLDMYFPSFTACAMPSSSSATHAASPTSAAWSVVSPLLRRAVATGEEKEEEEEEEEGHDRQVKTRKERERLRPRSEGSLMSSRKSFYAGSAQRAVGERNVPSMER